MLTDTHAHLFWKSFENDFDEMIQRALDAKVTTIINVGTDIETSQLALRQAQELTSSNIPTSLLAEQSRSLTLYSSIGIHPHDAVKFAKNPEEEISKAINKLEEIHKSNPQKVVAVGECGLDFVFENNPDFIPTNMTIDQIKNLQKLLLKAHVNLAKKLDLPLLIHTREAWDKIWDLIENHFGILHCYSGDLEVTKKAINSNFLISFAATITYPKNEFLKEAARILPLEKIVLETDCPFLPPQSKRGQRNDPSSIKEIAELIAELKNTSYKEVANQTTINAKTLLNLS